MKQKASARKQEAVYSFAAQKRGAGILLHLTSLPSPFGIGDMGPQAMAFADFLNRSGQTYWQLLPLNPTTGGQGNSPYSANSGMAGNPLLISPELLVAHGLLLQKEITPYKTADSDKVDYEKAQAAKYKLLEKAYARFAGDASLLEKEMKAFCRREAYWIDDFALYTVVKKMQGDKQWSEWDEAYKQHDAKTLKRFAGEHTAEILEVKWQQMIFARQWQGLKQYCNSLSIQLFGDMPFYVAYDSADVWSHQHIFSIDEDGRQQFAAGTPPDDFNANGQLWGMPIFRWDVLQQQNYAWWIRRLRKNLELFDLLRLDHFRAFAAYWQVKAGAETALKGEWIPAPGHELFTVLKKELGGLRFVAEDLGHIDAPVYKLRDDFELPGMSVLEFAFGEDMPLNVHIPHHHTAVSVVYTGTHDTNTILGWYKALPKQSRDNLSAYAGIKITPKNVCSVVSRMVYASVAKLAILPMQDILELGEEARMNIPSSAQKNWAWRMLPEQMSGAVEKQLKEWCIIYDRNNEIKGV